jgi:molecular chaperone GrpE
MSEKPSRGAGATAEPEGPEEATSHGEAEDERASRQIADLNDRWRRAAADLDNFRKRFARELERGRAEVRERILGEWVSVVDDLERALAHATKDPTSILEGLGAILERAWSIMERFGYPRFGETGVPFDPARHEAMSTVEADDEHPPGTVVAITRAGYGAGDRILRPAGVVVTRPEA